MNKLLILGSTRPIYNLVNLSKNMHIFLTFNQSYLLKHMLNYFRHVLNCFRHVRFEN